jgi:hypothetical protein
MKSQAWYCALYSCSPSHETETTQLFSWNHPAKSLICDGCQVGGAVERLSGSKIRAIGQAFVLRLGIKSKEGAAALPRALA